LQFWAGKAVADKVRGSKKMRQSALFFSIEKQMMFKSQL